MKKIVAILFTLCLILTGCSTKKSENITPGPCPTPDPIPTYTNEEIRHKLKSTCFEYQTRAKDKQQFKITGDINIPDLNFEGMNVFKNLELIIDNKLNDPYLKMKTDVYLKENNQLSSEPIKRLELIKQTESISLLNQASVEYMLSDVKDGKKSYTKTVEEYGALNFNIIMQGLVALVKEFKIEDLPKTITYTYDRNNVTYGMKFGFKDLEGTQLSEGFNALLGFFPELNELLLQFKDEIVINIGNIYLDVPVSTFNISVAYPAMQGQFLFPIIEGNFQISFKSILREDSTKFKIDQTYLKGRLGNNNVGNYLTPVMENDKEVYQTGIVIDSLIGIDLTSEDILKEILSRKFQITAQDARSIKYYDRVTKEEIDVNNNVVTVGLLKTVLIIINYDTNINHVVNISLYSGSDSNDPGSEQI